MVLSSPHIIITDPYAICPSDYNTVNDYIQALIHKHNNSDVTVNLIAYEAQNYCFEKEINLTKNCVIIYRYPERRAVFVDVFDKETLYNSTSNEIYRTGKVLLWRNDKYSILV